MPSAFAATSATAAGTSDVMIVGGGLQGLASALELVKRGLRVRLFESEYCGRHASGVNAGGVRTSGRHVAEIPLALAAREQLWHRLPEILGDGCGFVPSGHLQVAENEADEIKSRKRLALLHGMGFSHEQWVDARQARELVPLISPHVVGGIWVDRDGYALPIRVVTAYRQSAERLGAQIHENTSVTELQRHGQIWSVQTPTGTFQAPWLVNTAGAWAAEVATRVGDRVPLEVRGLMLMVTQRMTAFVRPVLGTAGRPLSFKQFDNGTAIIGGGMRCGADARHRHAMVDVTKIPKSARIVLDLFPHLRDVCIARVWTGIEGFMPDQIPVIGPSAQAENLVHAFGFCGHGFALAPIVGRIVADLVTRGGCELPIRAFRANRFGP